MLSHETINEEFKRGMEKLIKKYGKYSVPKSEQAFVSEVYRAKHACLIAGSTKLDATIMRQYSIMGRVIEHLCGSIPDPERHLKYSDRRRIMENWCAENIDVTITPAELAEVGDVSYATAIKFINERVDLFRKVERGRYIVRNLRADK
jgi:hypothetical protein